jgi:hypothetical protein
MPTQLKMAAINSTLAAAAKASMPTQLKMAAINSTLAAAMKASMPTQLKMAAINSTLAAAAKASMPTQLKMPGLAPQLAQAISAATMTKTMRSPLAGLKMPSLYPQLAETITSAAVSEEDVSREVDEMLELVRSEMAGTEVLAALGALIVLSWLLGFWLSEVNRTGSYILMANRFGLLADGTLIWAATIKTYRLLLAAMRQFDD